MKRKRIIILIIIFALIGGAGIAIYYNYLNTYYVITDNAQVASDLIKIYPQIQGKLSDWNVKEGDIVKLNQIIGSQDMEASVRNNVMNPQTLNNDAGSYINKAEIKAPINGKVIQISAPKEEMVSPSTCIAIIANTSNIYINANIKETDIERIQVGQKVEISIDSFPNKLFTGYVENSGQATGAIFSLIPAQNASGNYTKITALVPVKINIINDDNVTLMPGMNANVKIHIK